MTRVALAVSGLAVLALLVGACGGAPAESHEELPKLVYFYADW